MDKPHTLEDAFQASLPERTQRHADAVAELGRDPSRQAGKVKTLAAHYGRHEPAPSEASRKALIDILTVYQGANAVKFCDILLAELWARGHKLVPLDDNE